MLGGPGLRLLVAWLTRALVCVTNTPIWNHALVLYAHALPLNFLLVGGVYVAEPFVPSRSRYVCVVASIKIDVE